MDSAIAMYFVNYMLVPVITLILGILSVIIAKKNQLLSNRKAVTYVLLSSVFFALFGTSGFFGEVFMPSIFLFLQFLFIILGLVNYKLLIHFASGLKEKKPIMTLLIITLQVLLSWGIFALIFNLTNGLQYGYWAATPVFLLYFIPLFIYMYEAYLQIPAEIHKMRIYSSTEHFEPPQASIDVEKLLVCEIEVSRSIGDKTPIRIKAKTMRTFIFGEWFGMIVNDYNTKKVDKQIEICNDNDPYGWIFYTEQSFFQSRKYVDPDLSFEDNKLEEKDVIVAKRVRKM